MSWITYRRRCSRHRPVMTWATLLRFAASASVVAVAAVSCGGSNPAKHPSAYRPPATSPGSALVAATVTMATSPLGQILVDGGGRTLYLFEHDTGHGSTCYGACAASWPPLLNKGPEAGTGISAVQLGTAARGDGTTQVTFEGHPLYYYVGDNKPGDTSGQNLDQFGAKWYVLSSNGEAISPVPSSASAAPVSVNLSEFKVGLASTTPNPG
jgi:predicted lipoprotein with Yx(FWY)xxD motif